MTTWKRSTKSPRSWNERSPGVLPAPGLQWRIAQSVRRGATPTAPRGLLLLRRLAGVVGLRRFRRRGALDFDFRNHRHLITLAAGLLHRERGRPADVAVVGVLLGDFRVEHRTRDHLRALAGH